MIGTIIGSYEIRVDRQPATLTLVRLWLMGQRLVYRYPPALFVGLQRIVG